MASRTNATVIPSSSPSSSPSPRLGCGRATRSRRRLGGIGELGRAGEGRERIQPGQLTLVEPELCAARAGARMGQPADLAPDRLRQSREPCPRLPVFLADEHRRDCVGEPGGEGGCVRAGGDQQQTGCAVDLRRDRPSEFLNGRVQPALGLLQHPGRGCRVPGHQGKLGGALHRSGAQAYDALVLGRILVADLGGRLVGRRLPERVRKTGDRPDQRDQRDQAPVATQDAQVVLQCHVPRRVRLLSHHRSCLVWAAESREAPAKGWGRLQGRRTGAPVPRASAPAPRGTRTPSSPRSPPR